MPELRTEGNVWMVAKAVALVLHGDEKNTLSDKNQRGITELNEWCTENSLSWQRENKCSVILKYKKVWLPSTSTNGVEFCDSTVYII